MAFAPVALAGIGQDGARVQRERLRALIDYAKPAHASYALWSNLP